MRLLKLFEQSLIGSLVAGAVGRQLSELEIESMMSCGMASHHEKRENKRRTAQTIMENMSYNVYIT